MRFQTPARAAEGADAPPPGPVGDDEIVATARARAAELGHAAVGAHTAAMLGFLACALRAKAILEIGTGAGVSGLAMLRGMLNEGVLTSIDIEPECQRQARKSFTAAGFTSGRTRLIAGQALNVLPRFTAGGYDLVFVDGSAAEYVRYYEQGVPLLRPGGVLAFHGQPAEDMSSDTSQTLRQVAQLVRGDERLVPAALPHDAALLLATLT